jgi:hypothetical protein
MIDERFFIIPASIAWCLYDDLQRWFSNALFGERTQLLPPVLGRSGPKAYGKRADHGSARIRYGVPLSGNGSRRRHPDNNQLEIEPLKRASVGLFPWPIPLIRPQAVHSPFEAHDWLVNTLSSCPTSKATEPSKCASSRSEIAGNASHSLVRTRDTMHESTIDGRDLVSQE